MSNGPVLLGKIQLRNDTDCGLNRFADTFTEVLSGVFNQTEQRAIVDHLDYVRWTRVKDQPNTMAYVRSVSPPRSYAVFFAECFFGESDRLLKWVVTHELVHVLQFVGLVETTEDQKRIARCMAKEYQADERAERAFGPAPSAFFGRGKEFPKDDDWDRLANDWGYLSEAQRLELRALSAALVHEAKAAQREAG